MFHSYDLVEFDTSSNGTMSLPYCRVYGLIDLGRRCGWPTPFYNEFVAGTIRIQTVLDGIASWKTLTDATMSNELPVLSIKVGDDRIRATLDQVFITDSSSKQTSSLMVGDMLRTCIDGTVGTVSISSIETWPFVEPRFNIATDGIGNGYAGPNGVLVKDSSGS